MKDDYYQKNPGKKLVHFWIGFLIPILEGFLSAIMSQLKINSMILYLIYAATLLIAIYFITFGGRRYIGIGILALPTVVLIAFGGCFLLFKWNL